MERAPVPDAAPSRELRDVSWNGLLAVVLMVLLPFFREAKELWRVVVVTKRTNARILFSSTVVAASELLNYIETRPHQVVSSGVFITYFKCPVYRTAESNVRSKGG